jgi:hypothetical protein
VRPTSKTSRNSPERVRRPGGGRKRKRDTDPQLVVEVQAVLREHTAGSPTDADVVWTDLTVSGIAEHLHERGLPVSVHIVEQVLEELDYHRRKAQKSTAMGWHRDRDAQFENIARLRQAYAASPDPILSIDTKKRELLGNFFRPGQLLTTQTLRTWDHDFPSFAEGVAIPHGVYDLKRNWGHIHLGTSHDTSAFACDCLADWWERFGKAWYPQAQRWLLVCDGGGSNSSRTYLFKADLQALVNQTGLEVRVAHYPPYTSKYNPIEHRLFPHLTRASQGVVLTTIELLQRLLQKTKTRTGLRVVVDVVHQVYATGRKVAQAVKDGLNLVRDDFLPLWNYRLLPQT